MDYPSETSLCKVAPYPTDTPSPIFSEVGLLGGWGASVHRLSEMNNPSSNCALKLTDKVRRIPRLTRIIRLQCKNGHFCYKWMSRPGLKLGVRVSAFAFCTQIIFKLTIGIFMRKIISEVKYSIKSMIYQMLKFFKRIAYFIPRWS